VIEQLPVRARATVVADDLEQNLDAADDGEKHAVGR
jgi:hypothetical protein